MWEPVGPLPAAVYWRRRAVAAMSTVAVVGLLAWSLVGLVPARETTTTRAASRAAVSAPQPTAPPPASTPTPASTPGAGTPQGDPTDPAAASAAASPAPATGLRAAATRRHPARVPARAAPDPGAGHRPGPVLRRHDRRRGRDRPGGAPARPATDAAAGRDQHQRAAVRARPRLGTPGDRGVERGRQGPALVEQRLRQRVHGRPAHAGAGPAGGLRGGLGRTHLGARLHRQPAPSCRPASTG